MEKKIYVAYGSNTYAPQMNRRCPEARLVGTGMLKDYELEFRGAATVVHKPGAQVPVVLWEITELNEMPVTGMLYVKNGGSIFPPKEGYAKRMLLGYRQNGLDVQYIHDALDRAYLAQEDQDEDLSETLDFRQE